MFANLIIKKKNLKCDEIIMYNYLNSKIIEVL